MSKLFIIPVEPQFFNINGFGQTCRYQDSNQASKLIIWLTDLIENNYDNYSNLSGKKHEKLEPVKLIKCGDL